jgi:DNA-binding transcriptional LysR family regulator
LKNVTLRQLRVFAAVARQLSFGKAAEELHLTPPAVSMQIRELEQQVGLPLFDRSPKRVGLTTTGEYLLGYVLKILANLKDAEDAVARLAGLQGGRLTIGMVSTAKYFLPRLLTQFHELHPDVEIRLTASGNRELLVVAMQRNEVDLAVMGRPPSSVATQSEPFAPHPHVVVTPPEHPLVAAARCGALPATALLDYGFIVREPGSGTRAALEQYLHQYRIAPRIEMEMASNETIKQAVMAGMGVSFLSLHTIGLELRSGLVATPAIEGMPILRQWYVVNNLAKVLSPAAEAFRSFVLERGAGYLDAEFGQLPAASAAIEGRFGGAAVGARPAPTRRR